MSDKEVKRTTNLTKASLAGVILRRQADLDIDTGGKLGTGSFTNWFGADELESAFAWNPANASKGQGHSISLTPQGTTSTALRVTGSILDSSCSPTNIAADGPVRGDYGVTLEYAFGTLTKSASKSVTVIYRRD